MRINFTSGVIYIWAPLKKGPRALYLYNHGAPGAPKLYKYRAPFIFLGPPPTIIIRSLQDYRGMKKYMIRAKTCSYDNPGALKNETPSLICDRLYYYKPKNVTVQYSCKRHAPREGAKAPPLLQVDEMCNMYTVYILAKILALSVSMQRHYTA